MAAKTHIHTYADDLGNKISSSIECAEATIIFRGENNTLVIRDGAQIQQLEVYFDCNNGYLEIGACSIPGKGIKANIRVGEKSKIIIGDNFTCTSKCMISAVECSNIFIGNDCMIAAQNEIKTDDSHPIFDVRTGKRVNMPKSIHMGNHVWLARRAVVLGGGWMGDGSILGYNSVLKGRIPNNCIAVGIPARVTKKDIAWERPHLSLVKPYVKPDATFVNRSPYWNLTNEDEMKDGDDIAEPRGD
ncbi:MAG: acyltransferase [Acidovorax sp.]|uniref:acyltransferase n=1 Tax=Acidovorax sp. TaxID=1872122 RepID=UPI0039E6BDFB